MSVEAKEARVQSEDMVNIEVDGKPLQAPKGSMIIEATDKAGIEIPRFCYHPKLSIAANCRMCLVDVEKMPKPVPACATPVMEGMKIYTHSRRAIDAQHGVMEFLLINHPLDCPICDQGGECELQDLAMGYGRSVSRFTERKRVVKDKNVGPLVKTDMTRCIHCTRCVRFLEEIAGTCEMGGGGRGDRLEIGTLVQNSIDSELSGNIIDLCPVGALTNKPFRYSARAWELVARPSVAAHDGVGSNLYYHVRNGRVMRAVPRDNEDINESWLSDRDRYSHFGLYTEDRVLQPQVKENGEWKIVSWSEAVSRAAELLRRHAGAKLGALMSPSAATEEYFLAQSLLRRLGSPNIDHRLRQRDFADDPACPVEPDFGRSIAGLEDCDAALLVGCNPRLEAPIVGHRLRKAWQGGAKLSVLNPVDWPLIFDTDLDAVLAPQHMVGELAALAGAVARVASTEPPEEIRAAVQAAEVGERHEALARRLSEAERGVVLVGQFAMAHESASWLRALSAWIAQTTACALNVLPHGGNPRGAWRAGAVPHRGPGGQALDSGLNAAEMLGQPLDAYLLWDFEPDYDVDDPGRAMQTLSQAQAIVAVAAFATDSLKAVADVLLPLAPAAESEGSRVNFDGRTQVSAPVGKPSGDARSGWKILRRLGGELGLEGFDQNDLDQVRADLAEAVEAAGAVDTRVSQLPPVSDAGGFYRIGEVAVYSVDPLCRRSVPLQQTALAATARVSLSPADAERLGAGEGDRLRLKQGDGTAEAELRLDARVPAGAVWLHSGTCTARTLGPAVAPLELEIA